MEDASSLPECAKQGSNHNIQVQRAEFTDHHHHKTDADIEDRLHSEKDSMSYEDFFADNGNYHHERADGLSPRDFDSGIHMSYCLSLDSKDSEHIRSSSQECLLSPGSRMSNNSGSGSGMLHSRHSDSSDSFSSMSIHSLDANDTVDSLETHYNSGHSEMNSPDLHKDFESGASALLGEEEEMPMQLGEHDDDECKLLDIETMSLSRSSSEETLKTENEEDEREQELILADFLDQLQDQDRSSSCELNDDKNNDNGKCSFKNLSKYVPNGSKQRTLKRCNSQPEFASRHDTSFAQEHQHKENSRSSQSKNGYKRSNSSDEFRYSHRKRSDENSDFRFLPLGNMAETSETNNDMQEEQDKTSPTNRFICYDSLPLVVEVCEAEYTSPTHHASDCRRLSSEYGPYGVESPKMSRKHRNRRMDWQRKFSPKASVDEDTRETSLESTTTEDTLPKSTSLSSGPTTPESDKWHSRDNPTLISSEADSFSDSAKEHQKSPEKDMGYRQIPSQICDTKNEKNLDNTMDEKANLCDASKDTYPRSSGKTKLTRSNRVTEETEKSIDIATKDDVSNSNKMDLSSSSAEMHISSVDDSLTTTKTPSSKPSKPDCNSEVTVSETVPIQTLSNQFSSPKTSPRTSPKSSPKSSPKASSSLRSLPKTLADNLPRIPSPKTSPRSSPRSSPRTSPETILSNCSSPRMSPKSHCRRKENQEIANLTKKVSMKQEEVLQSAEEVLSSANQVSYYKSQKCYAAFMCMFFFIVSNYLSM